MMIAIDVDTLFDLLVSHLRYSMGRRTYITAECARTIRNHWRHLDNAQRLVLLRDLREQMRRTTAAGRQMGDPQDHAVWTELLAWMGEKLEAEE